MTDLTRRGLIGTGLAAAGASLAVSPLALAAEAAKPSDYKALICVFLFGGLDHNELLIPADKSGHRDYISSRGALATLHEKRGRARSLGNLQGRWEDAAGAPYGLPPEMPKTAALMAARKAAVVANVGPLVGPVTAAQLDARSVPTPDRLFSHVHQRNFWRRLVDSRGVQAGWSTRMASTLNGPDPLGVVMVGQDEGFTVGTNGPGVAVPRLEPFAPWGTGDSLWGDEELPRIFFDHLGSAGEDAGFLEQAFAAKQQDAAAVGRQVAKLMAGRDRADFIAGKSRPGDLRYEMAVIAKMIARRKEVGVKRQVFYVELHGFDTHSKQADRLPLLLKKLDDSLGAFMAWAEEAGVSDQVALFTASEFGRSLVPNKSGTDHGWGTHQLVVGGPVQGGRVFGEVPPAVTGHAMDAGRGRVVPNLAIEQMIVPLARWFGVPEADMNAVFPYADRFDTRALPLIPA